MLAMIFQLGRERTNGDNGNVNDAVWRDCRIGKEWNGGTEVRTGQVEKRERERER